MKSGLATEAFVGQLHGWEQEGDMGQSALSLLPSAHTLTEMLTCLTYISHTVKRTYFKRTIW